ncbi:hypothetical protein THIOKS12640008 [Thiocapsa sp. KS1]|nr:hypothetical protein THIOKS12640008 [Thiocapsa sp. KS1]
MSTDPYAREDSHEQSGSERRQAGTADQILLGLAGAQIHLGLAAAGALVDRLQHRRDRGFGDPVRIDLPRAGSAAHLGRARFRARRSRFSLEPLVSDRHAGRLLVALVHIAAHAGCRVSRLPVGPQVCGLRATLVAARRR